MRENMGLYRGKRQDNGEWEEGDLFHNHDGRVFVGELVVDDYTEGRTADRYTLGIAFAEVIPETVGQFVGRCDSNGTKVFDGDIVKVILGVGCVRPVVGVIRYRDCGFHFDFEQHGKVLFGEWAHEFYVIGNIHDNPELLEVK